MFPTGRAEAWSSRCASAVENDYRRCGGVQPEVEAWNVDGSLRPRLWLRVSEIGHTHLGIWFVLLMVISVRPQDSM